MTQRRRAQAGSDPIRPEDAPGRSAAPGPGPESDPEAVKAVLSVFRHVDLPAQLGEMLGPVVAWTQAAGAVAVAADEETGGMIPVAWTLDDAHPLLAELRAMAPPVGRHDLGRQTPTPTLAEIATAVEARGGTMLVPLEPGDGRAVAALLVVEPTGDGMPHLAALRALARPALANALQVRAIRELTIRDDTAECFNRRHFEESLVEELARANRFKTPMSLIFFDMDNLKEVNSRLGHAVGSRTLLEVSRRVRVKIRKFDKLFRFGGDEFCIVLPETEWHGALEVAERAREAISTRAFLLAELGAEDAPRMTASFGIASFPLHARSKEDLVVRADRAMQSVKTTTKNSIAVAEMDDHGAR